MGADWKRDYVPRPAVADYLSHLEILEKEDPYLLTAYFYHLYMGLLSGGQGSVSINRQSPKYRDTRT